MAKEFPSDFIFGTASSSFQVEGGASEKERGKSIWDDFCEVPGAIFDGSNGIIACDHYHRYAEDIEMLKKLGTGSYRFSISWPRIIPDGDGSVSETGITFYKNLLFELQRHGIKAVATLYHWDLPSALEAKGGWRNRATAEAFCRYAEVCFSAFNGLVDSWITFNEPFCSSVLGHLYGIHAPGMKDREATHRVIHHQNLAHGLAMKAFSDGGYLGAIGITLNLGTPKPLTDNPRDIEAADRAADLNSRMFLDPVIGLGYPQRYLDTFPEAPLPIESGDMDIIAGSKLDFLGINYYTEETVKWDDSTPEHLISVPTNLPKTAMDWDITPEGFLRLLQWTHKKTGDTPIYITENGSAWHDTVTLQQDGTKAVHDPQRIDYLEKHLDTCLRAIAEGIPVSGYYAWCNMDNFEWAYGYSRRFGIIYCDFKTQERIPKDSFYRYQEIIRTRCL